MVEDGRVVGIDEENLAHRSQQVWERYKASIVAWDYAKRPADVMYPPLLPLVRRRSRDRTSS